MTNQQLESIAKKVRRQILDMALQAKHAHLGGAMSCVEILVALYLGGIMKFDVNDPESETRDRFILSKAHCSTALYAVLNQAGIIPNEDMAKYHTNGYYMHVHPRMNIAKGIEASGGSLGQGLPLAAGLALALRLKNNSAKVYCLLGDGECNEGSIWEAAAFITHMKLTNLITIIDKNNIQSDGFTADVLNFEPFADKWRAFGFEVSECDGHDFNALPSAFAVKSDKPICVIANTVKGKGVRRFENAKDSHHVSVSQKVYDEIVAEMEALA